jgi:hypothetical protein
MKFLELMKAFLDLAPKLQREALPVPEELKSLNYDPVVKEAKTAVGICADRCMAAEAKLGRGLDRTGVAPGGSFSVSVSGPNLTTQTFFDIRFTSPGSNVSDVVLNWQRGVAASHAVPVDTASGIWKINGIRAHQVETDHTGNFLTVSATITVSP